MLSNTEYCNKIQHQIERSSFSLLEENPTRSFNDKVNTWIEKWFNENAIDKNWKRFISPNESKPGMMYGLIKTHKVDNPTRVITSGCGTAIENLSIFVEKCLFEEIQKIDTRIRTAGKIRGKNVPFNSPRNSARSLITGNFFEE